MGLFDELIARIEWQESRGDPNAVSPKGAFGPMQLMPHTARDPGFGVSPFNAAAPDPVAENRRMGRDYFAAMLDRYGEPEAALVAYNWGPGNADEWISGGRDPNALPAETQNYVASILGGGASPQPMRLAPPEAQPMPVNGGGLLGDAFMGEGVGQGLGLLNPNLDRLLQGGDPLFNLGVGIQGASGPSPFPVSMGQVLAQGFQSGGRATQMSMRNEAMRENLRQLSQQRAASERLRGVLSSMDAPAGVSGELFGTLAELDPGSALKMLMPKEPKGLEAKLATTQGALGRPLSEDEILKLAGGGTTINIGDQLNSPIPIAQIANVRLPDGQAVPIGTTFAEARSQGAQVLSSSEQDRGAQSDSALMILGELEQLATGPEGIFTQIDPGVVNRGTAAALFAIDDLTQSDPRVSRFRSLSEGSIAPIIRTLGEKGSLSDSDTKRALSLLPEVFPLPDTGEVATAKLSTLRSILEKGIANLNRQQSGDAGQGGGSPSSAPAADSQTTFATEREFQNAVSRGAVKVGDIVTVGGKRFRVDP